MFTTNEMYTACGLTEIKVCFGVKNLFLAPCGRESKINN